MVDNYGLCWGPLLEKLMVVVIDVAISTAAVDVVGALVVVTAGVGVAGVIGA